MPQVLLYGTRFCPFCAAARHLLTAKNVQYDDISVDDDQTLRAKIFTQSGQRTVPQIWIVETHIGGYSELQALETKGELDLLLSPGLN